MPLGTLGNGLGPYWAVVLPVEKTNFADNPSYERGTAGAAQVLSATLGSTSAEQTYGAWSLWFTPSSNGTAGAYIGTVQAQSGTAYTASAHVMGSAGVDYMLAVADTSNALVGSALFTGGGTWQRYSVSYTENSNTTRRIIVRKANAANAASLGTVYVDGWGFEAGSLTTYIDGDQEGCQWIGAPHQSQSYRDGQSRAGGSVVALADIGFAVDDAIGVGMPPLENSYQSYAILDGAQYQRTRAGVRAFTLSSYLVGTSWQDLHTQRRTAINAFKIDAVDQQQATRFWYIGAGGTVQIDAYLDAGLEMGQNDGFEETVGVRFVAYEPYFESTWQQGTALAARQSIGSVRSIFYRDAIGQWGTMGAGLNGVSGIVDCMAYSPSGTLYVGGLFDQVDGTAATGFAQWYNGAWGTPGALSAGFEVWSMAMSPSGTLFLGGDFTAAAGTQAPRIAQYVAATGRFGTLTGGTLNGAVYSLLYAPSGTLFAGGTFGLAGGTAAIRVAQYVNGAWGTLTGGTIGVGGALSGSVVYSLAMPRNGTLYVAGAFGSVASMTANNIAYYANGAWGTLLGGLTQTYSVAGTRAYAMAVAPDQRLYVAGQFRIAGVSTVNGIAAWNQSGWTDLAGGIVGAGGSSPIVTGLSIGSSGQIIVGGNGVYGGSVLMPEGLMRWNGYSWLPIGMDIPGNMITYAVLQAPSGTTFVGGQFFGTAQVSSVARVVNQGMAQTYPTVTFQNTSASGTARIYLLENATTDDTIAFNLSLLAGESATLTLTPGARSFTSNFRGNIFGNILGGSNLATWRLIPGTNYVTMFADNDSLQTSIYWTPRHWSADAGTTF